jgi:hypothetical protein
MLARDWGAEPELPPLAERGQHARQLVEPRLHVAAKRAVRRWRTPASMPGTFEPM